MIFYDSSEARDRSRVADALAASDARPVTGLERETGADFLVSALPVSLPPVLREGVLPHQVGLRKHLAVGALVQRKSGRDLVSSVKNLTSNILPRMRAVRPSQGCWLLATGCYGRDDGSAVTVGCSRLPTGVSWNALNGALRAWQLDGGYYDVVGDDDLVVPWLENLDTFLALWKDGRPPKWVMRQPTRDVLLSDKDNCALQVLAALPGIGEKRARACLDVWGDLSTSLMWLSDPELHDSELYPPGIGVKTLEGVRECLGGQLQRLNNVYKEV